MTAETSHDCIAQKRRNTFQNMQEIVKLAKKFSPKLVRGYSTGNVSVVDKKSWLEVCDRKHRYGANLRAYYKEWKRIKEPKPGFWEWLDDDSVEVEGVPRKKLESETVLYCNTAAERQKFALSIHDGKIYQEITQTPISTGEEGWIFVLRDGTLYGSQKVTEQIPRIHHTSFFAGECVQAAGMMVVEKGDVKSVYPHSGHYRPSENEVLIILEFLQDHGIDLKFVEVDVQRVMKVNRDEVNGKRVKKVANAHFWNALTTLHYLRTKQFAWRNHLFDDLVVVANRWHRASSDSATENSSSCESGCGNDEYESPPEDDEDLYSTSYDKVVDANWRKNLLEKLPAVVTP